jgi:hypothetical protein
MLAPIFLCGVMLISTPPLEGRLEELAETAMASRRKIINYHIVANVKFKEGLDGPDKWDIWEGTYEVWSKGTQFRTDKTTLASSVQQNDINHRNIYCRNCEHNGFILRTNQGPKYLTAVSFVKINDTTDEKDEYRIDWRHIGLKTGGLNKYRQGRPEDSILALKKRPNLTIEQFERAEQKLIALTGFVGTKSDPVSRTTIEFSQTLDGNPISFTFEHDKQMMYSNTSIEYQSRSGIWFPKTYQYQKKHGKNVLEEVLISFTLVELNTPIPDEVFQLKGLGLRVGTPIEPPGVTDRAKQPVWLNEIADPKYSTQQMAQTAYQATRETNFTEAKPDIPAPNLVERRWPYFVMAGFFALSGLLIARKLFRPNTQA